ncbi:MAG: hypothetical protein HY959_01460 [Ignavibacteriae bacterium]|nr:hypothetical protein [Ignavibacteriota bacterium]
MKRYNLFFSVFIFLMAFFSCTPPLDMMDSPEYYFLYERDRFYADPLVFYDYDSLKPRLDIYLSIPAENILFKKTGANGFYEMKLNISVSLTGTDSSASILKNYDVLASYTEGEMKKISRESRYYFYSYYVNPGKYRLEIKISDNNAGKYYRKKNDLTVKNFSSDAYSCSDVMVLSNYNVSENGRKDITPLVTNNISKLSDVNIFFEIYSGNETPASKELVFKIKDSKGKYIKEESADLVFADSVNKFFRNVLSRSEFIKHKPEQTDFEEFDPEDRNFGTLLLEIWDKRENKIIASKKLSVLPDRSQRPQKMRREQGIH